MSFLKKVNKIVANEINAANANFDLVDKIDKKIGSYLDNVPDEKKEGTLLFLISHLVAKLSLLSGTSISHILSGVTSIAPKCLKELDSKTKSKK